MIGKIKFTDGTEIQIIAKQSFKTQDYPDATLWVLDANQTEYLAYQEHYTDTTLTQYRYCKKVAKDSWVVVHNIKEIVITEEA